jgi:hypothetical protein
MVHEVGVQRVVPGDQHRQSLPAGPPGPTRLLPQRSPRARIPADQHGIQPDQVDAELERVGRRQPEQLPAEQLPLDLPPVLLEVTGPVRGHPVTQTGHDLVELAPGNGGHDLRPAPGPDERQRPGAGHDRIGEQVGGLPQRGPPHLGQFAAPVPGHGHETQRLLSGQQRRLPERERHTPTRRRILDNRGDRQPDQPGRGVPRISRGGRGQHERG